MHGDESHTVFPVIPLMNRTLLVWRKAWEIMCMFDTLQMLLASGKKSGISAALIFHTNSNFGGK